MKASTALVAFAAAGWLAAARGWLDEPRSWLDREALAPEEQAAVELQCRGMSNALRTSCEQEVAASVASGEIDPEPILRVHCTRFDNLWAETPVEIPPSLCIERYGGWLHG